MRIHSLLSSMAASLVLCFSLDVCDVRDARADDKTDCADAHASGQRQQRDGHFREARRLYELCSRAVCPAVLTNECTGFLAKLADDMPSIVVAARDRSGKETLDVRIAIDGETIAHRITGLALPLDPGEHVLRFYELEGAVVEQTIVLHVGESNRQILVDFSNKPAETTVAPLPPPRRSLGPVYVLGGAGALALGAFAVSGIAALVEAHDLESTCAPSCGARMSGIQAMRAEGVVSDVSLAGAVVLLGTATTMYLIRRTPLSTTTAHFAPTRGNAATMVTLAFW
jgi:hypothetical protein